MSEYAALRQMYYEALSERDALRWENEELRKAMSDGAVQRVLQTRAENRTLRAEVEQLRSETHATIARVEALADQYEADGMWPIPHKIRRAIRGGSDG